MSFRFRAAAAASAALVVLASTAFAQSVPPPPPPPPPGVQLEIAPRPVRVEPLVSGADIVIELGWVVPTLSNGTFTATNGSGYSFTGAQAGLGYDLWPDLSLRLGVAFWHYFRIGVRAGFGVRDSPTPTDPAVLARFDQPGPGYQAHVELFPEGLVTFHRRFFVLGLATPVGYREIGLTLHQNAPQLAVAAQQLYLDPQVSLDLHFPSGMVIGWYAGLDLGVDLASGSTGLGVMSGFRFGGRGGLPPRGE